MYLKQQFWNNHSNLYRLKWNITEILQEDVTIMDSLFVCYYFYEPGGVLAKKAGSCLLYEQEQHKIDVSSFVKKEIYICIFLNPFRVKFQYSVDGKRKRWVETRATFGCVVNHQCDTQRQKL